MIYFSNKKQFNKCNKKIKNISVLITYQPTYLYTPTYSLF